LPGLDRSAALTNFFARLGAAPSSALLLDYDGTLAPFQIERRRAYPYPEVVPLLEGIIESGRTRVAIITGRPIPEVKTLLGSLRHLEIWGAHGLERTLPDGTYRQIAIDPESRELLSQVENWIISEKLSSLVEIKPGGIAIHWRGLPAGEIKEIEARVLKEWTPIANHPVLRLLRFDGGLELRVAHPDKGDAVAAIIEELEPAAPVAYLGDDLTDEDSFRVLNDHAANSRGLTVLVRPEYRETAAKLWLRPPRELAAFLEQWLNRVSAIK
jgi:trehalose 6-phosphate phosphatase